MSEEIKNNVVDFKSFLEKKNKAKSGDVFSSHIYGVTKEGVDSLRAEYASVMRQIPEHYTLLDEETEKLLLSTMATSPDGMHEEDGVNIIHWVEKQILAYYMICLAINGEISLTWSDKHKDVLFHSIDSEEG